jgi:signal transduction histidine kinase
VHTPGPHSRNRSTAAVSFAAGVVTAAVGGLALCGWIWDIHVFKTIYGPITMKANAAIGLLLCGVSLATLRFPWFSRACALAAGAIGALTLFQHLSGWNLGIDQVLFAEAPGAAGTTSPNRMGPNASLGFMLAAVALTRIGAGSTRGAAAAQYIALIAGVIAFVPLAGYLYGAQALYGVARYTGIALHTAITFVLLNVGILTARADVGPVSLFLSRGPAGTVVRWLAIPVVIVPLVFGYLEIRAREAEAVDRGMGIALYAIGLIVVFGIAVWRTARLIERSDQARREAERDRDLLIVSERKARAEAERSNRLKDQFLATLSHELRTPLNVMLGWTQVLERGVAPQDHPRIAGVVARNGRLLARLVGDLLDISRVTTSQFEIYRTATSLNAVVQSSLDAIGPSAEEKGVAVVADLDSALTSIDADNERLQQIVWNLLSNAVKFTSPGGRIVVHTAHTGEAATLSVSDTGIGFDSSFAPDLFKPFRQADSSARREHGGLGLGLSIARHLAELHGGSLTATSAGLGQGATFTLTIPRAANGAPARSQTSSSAPASTSGSVPA